MGFVTSSMTPLLVLSSMKASTSSVALLLSLRSCVRAEEEDLEEVKPSRFLQGFNFIHLKNPLLTVSEMRLIRYKTAS